MDEHYGADLITITDEDGKEYELELLSTVEYRGETYLAVIPADTPEDGDWEVSILRRSEEDGEEFLDIVEDEAELEAVYALFLDEMEDDEESEQDKRTTK